MKKRYRTFYNQYKIITMKKWIICGIFMIASFSVSFAQTDAPFRQNMEDRIESQRIAFITERVQLSPAEAQQYWPIYNDYRAREKELKAAKAPGKVLLDMNDQEAEAYISKVLEIEKQELEAKHAYIKQVQTVLSPRKVLRLFAAERKFKEELVRRINQQLNRRNK